jgi:glucosyl-3-phosphoglycerate synthase
MASQVLLTVADRLVREGRLTDPLLSTTLTQFRRGTSVSGVDRDIVLTPLSVTERPPLATLAVRRS